MRRSARSTPAELRRAVSDAVEAALSQDADRFAAAADRLAVQDQQRLGLVQAWVLRALLEQLYPDGLSGADAQDVLRRCLLSTAAWRPEADPGVLVRVLTGALGLADPDEASAAAGSAVLSQGAALLTADLLSAAGGALAGHLDAAFAELERAETIELP